MILFLFLGCAADETDTVLPTDECAAALTIEFFGEDRELTNCPPSDRQAFVYTQEQLADGPFVAGAFITNDAAFEPHQVPGDGKSVSYIFAWRLSDYIPEMFGDAVTVKDGVANTHATMITNGDEGISADIVEADVDGYHGWYFMGTEEGDSPFSAIYFLVDLEDDLALNYSGYLGGMPVDGITTDPASWPSGLTDHWLLVNGTTINTTD